MYSWKVQAVLVIGLTTAILGGFAWWVDARYADYSGMVIAWPGLTLARYGVSYACLPFIGTIVFIPAVTVVFLRKRPLLAVGIGGFIYPVLYCIVTYLWMLLFSAPGLSQISYGTNAEDRDVFLSAYRQGYICGLTGRTRTYCFAPKVETEGFESGLYLGLNDWHRFWGRKLPDQGHHEIHSDSNLNRVRQGNEMSKTNKAVKQTGN